MSVDAFHCITLEPQKSSGGVVAVRFVGVLGGVRSLLCSSVTVTALVAADRLPDESRARTANVCVVPGVRWRARNASSLVLVTTAPSIITW